MTKETKSADTRTANTTEETRSKVAPLGWDKISGSEGTSAEAPKHTPTPWRVMADPDNAGKHPFHDRRWIVSGSPEIEFGYDPRPHNWTIRNGSLICEMRDSVEDNAAFIVRAVNSHDELLAALKNSLAVLMETHKQARGMWNELLASGFADKDLKMPNHDANLAAIEKARAAIARAEGRAS